ncbi:unnamed protein product [Urochloa humidicola]
MSRSTSSILRWNNLTQKKRRPNLFHPVEGAKKGPMLRIASVSELQFPNVSIEARTNGAVVLPPFLNLMK